MNDCFEPELPLQSLRQPHTAATCEITWKRASRCLYRALKRTHLSSRRCHRGAMQWCHCQAIDFGHDLLAVNLRNGSLSRRGDSMQPREIYAPDELRVLYAAFDTAACRLGLDVDPQFRDGREELALACFRWFDAGEDASSRIAEHVVRQFEQTN